MATHYTCDFCGEPIIDEQLMVSLTGRGNAHDPDGPWGDPGRRHRWVAEQVGNYHATEERSCWFEMVDRIGLVHGVSVDIASSPDRVKRGHASSGRGVASGRDARDAAREAWAELCWDARESLICEALGVDRLTVRELAERVNVDLGAPAERFPAVSPEAVRVVAMRLVARGRLDRAPEGVFRGHAGIWQFYRPAADGPIVEPEQTLNGHGEVA